VALASEELQGLFGPHLGRVVEVVDISHVSVLRLLTKRRGAVVRPLPSIIDGSQEKPPVVRPDR
jgi:hypothetical protein